MRILNLYAGIGGNRELWGGDLEVTAVELIPRIAEKYKERFKDDEVIIADAHAYLLANYKSFDFIWSSPPCPTHSQVNTFLNPQGVIRYPDMSLYQEIIFLKHFYKGKFCVENVKSYYEPLIKPQELGRHYFWCNFPIPKFEIEESQIGRFGPTKRGRTDEKDKLIRNKVNPIIGKAILEAAFIKKQTILE